MPNRCIALTINHTRCTRKTPTNFCRLHNKQSTIATENNTIRTITDEITFAQPTHPIFQDKQEKHLNLKPLNFTGVKKNYIFQKVYCHQDSEGVVVICRILTVWGYDIDLVVIGKGESISEIVKLSLKWKQGNKFVPFVTDIGKFTLVFKEKTENVSVTSEVIRVIRVIDSDSDSDSESDTSDDITLSSDIGYPAVAVLDNVDSVTSTTCYPSSLVSPFSSIINTSPISHSMISYPSLVIDNSDNSCDTASSIHYPMFVAPPISTTTLYLLTSPSSTCTWWNNEFIPLSQKEILLKRSLNSLKHNKYLFLHCYRSESSRRSKEDSRLTIASTGHVCQLSYIYAVHGEVVKSSHNIIKPPCEYEVDSIALHFHGLTYEKCMEEGVLLRDTGILDLLQDDVALVGFDVEANYKMIMRDSNKGEEKEDVSVLEDMIDLRSMIFPHKATRYYNLEEIGKFVIGENWEKRGNTSKDIVEDTVDVFNELMKRETVKITTEDRRLKNW